MSHRAVIWFRNDLRLRDNQLFHYRQIRSAAELVAVYCLDPRHFETSRWGAHARTGAHRARFLAESLEELDTSLQRIGSRLVVVAGRPEDIVPALVGNTGCLAYQREDTYEEQLVEKRILERLPSSAITLSHFGHTLLHRDDLGWNPVETLPMPFGKYWHGECQTVLPRSELPTPNSGDLPKPASNLQLPLSGSEDSTCAQVRPRVRDLSKLMGFPTATNSVRDEVEFVWHGGEGAAADQMLAYAVSDGLGTHMRTRNFFSGLRSFSRLSPWLANGCLSPRTIYWWAKGYFSDKKNADPRFDHFHKLVFQLCWRDFFRFYCAHFGAKVFFLEGPALRKRPWRRDPEVESMWKEGQTGVPIIDALMRELSTTGYMSNRGRYVVASYLVFYLGIDWRVGADWFEHCLLDHDVCSNYGEWASMANVAVDLGDRYPMGLKGRGPSDGRDKGRNGGGGDPWAQGAMTGDAVFDPWQQARQYDRDESFVRRWVPEVRNLPKGQAHNPPAMRNVYPEPLASHALTLPKTSASGKKDGPYGPYFRDVKQTSASSTIRVRGGDASPGDDGYPSKRPMAQSCYPSTDNQASRGRRRWVAKKSCVTEPLGGA